MSEVNWSKDNCTCGYWDELGQHNKVMTKHEGDCPNTIYDNTPNAKFLMSLTGRDEHGNPSHRPI